MADAPIFDGSFVSWPVITDTRIDAGLTHCLACRAELAPATTSADGNVMLLFAHCRACNRVYVLEEMVLPESR